MTDIELLEVLKQKLLKVNTIIEATKSYTELRADMSIQNVSSNFAEENIIATYCHIEIPNDLEQFSKIINQFEKCFDNSTKQFNIKSFIKSLDTNREQILEIFSKSQKSILSYDISKTYYDLIIEKAFRIILNTEVVEKNYNALR